MPTFDPAFDLPHEAGVFPPAYDVAEFGSAVRRFFTEFLSSVNSYGEPSTTPVITRLVMDVYPTNGNSGLPTGAPSVTDNEWQTIDFTFSGSMPDIGRNGAVYFDGFIANLYAYNGATLLDFWSMDDDPDSTEFVSSSGSNNLIKQNINSDQTELYNQVVDGWTGPELWTFGDIVADGTEPIFTNLGGVSFGVVVDGGIYRTALIQNVNVPRLQLVVGNSGPLFSGTGSYSNDLTASIGTSLFARNIDVGAEGSLTEISVKRLLEVV